MAVIVRRIWTPEVMRELWDTPSPFYALITGKRPEPPRKPAPPRVVPLRSRKPWRRVARVVLS